MPARCVANANTRCLSISIRQDCTVSAETKPPPVSAESRCPSGTVGTLVPGGTRLSANNVTFTTASVAAIVTQTIEIATLVYVAGTGLCILTSVSAHLLATSMSIVIAGASDAAYNGTVVIVATDDNALTYRPATPPSSTSATGATLTATWGVATVTAGTVGQVTNISSGGTLLVIDSVPGADTTAIVTHGGIQGGSDQETPDRYRGRVLKALGTDFGAFTADEIEIVARSVPGVTRVFVRKASLFGSNGVNEGQVMVAFLRDDDVNPIPSAQEVADVKAAIVANCMTAHTAIEDVIVVAPTPHTVNFNFTSITPDTLTMRIAITAALAQYFNETATFATPIPALDYECAIKGAYDMSRRQKLSAWTLTVPTADITIAATEMPFLGAVTFGPG